LDAIIGEWTKQHSKRDAMEKLIAVGVPAGAVFDTDELINDPFLRDRGAFGTVDHPIRGKVTTPGWPVKMSDSNVPLTAAPLLGQDNPRVYAELLGCTPEQLEALRAEEVI